ncbi:MAG: hypothetical protein HY063_03595 [Bacteroidetes bacterium]|nr:hypothetical protein [Bacteroidota bacterium]
MNRKLFALFLVFLFSFSLFAQNKKKIKKEVKGFHIKSVTEMVTEYKDGKESAPRKDIYIAYDKGGKIIQKEDYHKDGTLKHKETYVYDGKGNKLEETIFDAAEKQPKPEKNIKYVSKYDSNGNETEKTEYDGNGKVIQKLQYSYNSKGDKILEVTYDGDGKLTMKTVYIFDNKGLRVEKKEYDGSNNQISSRKYTYQF